MSPRIQVAKASKHQEMTSIRIQDARSSKYCRQTEGNVMQEAKVSKHWEAIQYYRGKKPHKTREGKMVIQDGKARKYG